MGTHWKWTSGLGHMGVKSNEELEFVVRDGPSSTITKLHVIKSIDESKKKLFLKEQTSQFIQFT